MSLDYSYWPGIRVINIAENVDVRKCMSKNEQTTVPPLSWLGMSTSPLMYRIAIPRSAMQHVQSFLIKIFFDFMSLCAIPGLSLKNND